MLLVTSSITAHAENYTTRRLQTIDQTLKLTKNNYHIHRRYNSYGEVEHIGLALFPTSLPYELRPSCDFLERYLLEVNLTSGTENALILAQKPVYYNVGSPRTALNIDSLCDFNINEIEYHKSRVTWNKNGKKLLEIVYDLDWRMMSGCDTRELEQNLIRNLKRHKASTFNPLPESGTYIIGQAFNNNLYLENNKGNNTRQYVFNKKQMPHSVANLMLADDMPNEAYADITFSLYDNTPTNITLKWRDVLNYFRNVEHCTPFFAIKKKQGDNIEGLLLLANKNGGYMHMISVSITPDIITDNGKGTFKARLTAYIPMHNVKQEYLNLTEYETLR